MAVEAVVDGDGLRKFDSRMNCSEKAGALDSKGKLFFFEVEGTGEGL